ncbi:MAG TPA: type II secretion system F family protein [Anaerolineae bacterium]|nr:type II secretion system F family protein [Anaerolineae bacterium]
MIDSLQLSLAVGFLVTLSAALIYLGIHKRRTSETPDERLERLATSSHPIEDGELELPFLDRVIKPWLRNQVQAAGRLAPARDIQKLRQNLSRAGYPHGLGVMDFLGLRLLLALALGGLALLSLRQGAVTRAILGAALMSVAGFLLPDFWLSSLVKRRKKELRRAMPDALDMLTICVDAGSGLDAAMLKIHEKWDNAIAEEFGKVVAEIGIGLTRQEALSNMATRADLSEISSFVAVLQQADQFGLSIANVLHTQSEQMRVLRGQRAEEAARKIPIKLFFPLIFMIFPAMLAVTIGPAIPVLMGTFATLGT